MNCNRPQRGQRAIGPHNLLDVIGPRLAGSDVARDEAVIVLASIETATVITTITTATSSSAMPATLGRGGRR